MTNVGVDVFTVAACLRVRSEVLHLVPDRGERNGAIGLGKVDKRVV